MPRQTVTSPRGREFTMCEVVVPGLDGRCWEVVETETGMRFSATLYRRSLQGVLDVHDRIATQEDVLRAVAHAVDKAAAALLGHEQRGVCEVRVNGLEVHEALEMWESLPWLRTGPAS